MYLCPTTAPVNAHISEPVLWQTCPTHLKPEFYRKVDMNNARRDKFPLTRERRVATTMYRFVTSPNVGYIQGQEPSSPSHQGPNSELDGDSDSNTTRKRKRPKKIHTYQAWSIFPVYVQAILGMLFFYLTTSHH